MKCIVEDAVIDAAGDGGRKAVMKQLEIMVEVLVETHYNSAYWKFE